ncbi:MAG: hypothetical protein RMH75_05105 [Archaeoglobaceae archaeon]|nr:hypothetical protein [Archaeoglobaceae archaeon]
MYFEVWIDQCRKEEIIKKLKEVCEEVWEVYYNYDLIVKTLDESKIKLDGVLHYRRHYKC